MSNPLTDALRHSQERLADLARPLDRAHRRAPSYDTDWSVAQVFSHLGSGAEIFDLMVAAGLDDGPMPGPEVFAPIWERWNAKTPDEQVADSLVADERLVDRLVGLSPATRDAFHVAFAGMDVDADRLTSMRLGEHALHSWDIAVSLDSKATVAQEAVALLVDGLGGLAAHAPVNPLAPTT